MVEQDTIKLLRECDAGVKMGISSIGDVLGYVSSHDLKRVLQDSSEEHDGLKADLQGLLGEYHDEGKEPAAMAWVKTNVKLKMNESDSTVADLITDGCNMGVKSLSRYLNKYQAADERSKDIAKRIISAEDKLCTDVRAYL